MNIRRKARVFEMTPNIDRIVEAVLFLVGEADARSVPVTQYDLVKSLFLADRAHLNKYGRPITFDNYVAMTHGPVPSTAYNLLKLDTRTLQKYAVRIPWARRAAPELGNGCFAYDNPERSSNEDVLSPSDIEELRSSLTVVKTLGFKQVRKLTHEDEAYLDAWEDEGGRGSYPMSYTLLFETPSEEKARDLSFFSKHV